MRYTSHSSLYSFWNCHYNGHYWPCTVLLRQSQLVYIRDCMFVIPLRLVSRKWSRLFARALNLSLYYLNNNITRIHNILQLAVTIHDHWNFRLIWRQGIWESWLQIIIFKNFCTDQFAGSCSGEFVTNPIYVNKMFVNLLYAWLNHRQLKW